MKPALGAPILLSVLALFAAGAPSLEASPVALAGRIADRLAALREYTLDLSGTISAGAGMGGMAGGPKTLSGRMAIQDRGPGKAPLWKAALSLEVSLPFMGQGAQRLPVVAVQRIDGLYLSTPLPMPGMGAGRQMAFRVPGPPAASTEKSSFSGGARWVEEALRQAGTSLTQDGDALLFTRKRPGNPAGPQEIRLEVDGTLFPTHLLVREGGAPVVDLKISNLVEGKVDLSLPLPSSQYGALPTGALGGMLGGGATPSAPSTPSRSPFASGPAPTAPQASSPMAGLSGLLQGGGAQGLNLGGLQRMAQGLQSSGGSGGGGLNLGGLQKMMQGLQSSGGNGGGGLNLGGLQKMMQGLQSSGGSGGGGLNLGGLQKMMQGLQSSGGNGGSGLNLGGLQKMMQGLQSQGGSGGGGLDLSGLNKMLQGLQGSKGGQGGGLDLSGLMKMVQGMQSGGGARGGGLDLSGLTKMLQGMQSRSGSGGAGLDLSGLTKMLQGMQGGGNSGTPGPAALQKMLQGLQSGSGGGNVQELQKRLRALQSGNAAAQPAAPSPAPVGMRSLESGGSDMIRRIRERMRQRREASRPGGGTSSAP